MIPGIGTRQEILCPQIFFGVGSIDIRYPDTAARAADEGVAPAGGCGGYVLRPPTPADGAGIAALIRRCPPLDVNSTYCNLVQCAHFAATCVLAEKDGRPVGWVSAHRPPAAPDEIFVWQVAVAPEVRGSGLAGSMLEALARREAVRDARALTTTITAGNAASWALFEAFARRRGLRLRKTPFFDRERHFAGEHETEWLATIAPLSGRREPSAKEDT